MKLIDLAWITGKLGQPGCGVNTVTEEPNEQGAVDMGAAPEFLPGQASFNDQTARDRFAKAWDVTLPAAGSGANLVEILKRCRSGQIQRPLCDRRKSARNVARIDGSPRRTGSIWSCSSSRIRS